jgi:hypothetical protein
MEAAHAIQGRVSQDHHNGQRTTEVSLPNMSGWHAGWG